MPGDCGDNVLGENAGEIRGPNTLVSGKFDGTSAGPGSMFARESRDEFTFEKKKCKILIREKLLPIILLASC